MFYYRVLSLLAMSSLLLIGDCEAADAIGASSAVLVGRVIERLITVGFAGLSLVLGYRLFLVTEQHNGELLAKTGSYSLKMSRVAPGVFFAAFGCAVLSYSLFKAPEVKFDQNGNVLEVRGVTPSKDIKPSTSKDFIEALTTLQYLTTSGLQSPRKEFAEKMFLRLEPLKRDLVDGYFGSSGRYAEWASLNDLKKQNPGEVTARLERDSNLARRYNDADALLSQISPPP